ncbi:putative histone H2A variant 3 [Capsicum annuum]|nr:putative histone H2A variant 3 [Capsicum annuum]
MLSAPVMVAIGDVLLPTVLISSFTCVRCYSLKEHLQSYAFTTSLMDIPLVAILRSLIISCVYSMCDGPALSHGPYLGTATFCSVMSIILLSVKASVFSGNSYFEAEASSYIPKQKLHLNKSWGMPVLFISSIVFAVGHIVVAYRTSCRARRKLLFHRIDPEAVLPCKVVFSAYNKVPRSPTPSAGKASKCDSEMKRKLAGSAREDGEIPAKLLADVDSLFITCLGLTLHYKLTLPGSPCRSLSSTARVDRPPTLLSNVDYCIRRSYSSQYPANCLSTPLLDGFQTSPLLSVEMPSLNLDEVGEADAVDRSGSPHPIQDLEGNDQFGIVLVHGFGGGVFSWRNVMGVLAQQVGCVVTAFDRPGWGLTSRPFRTDWEEDHLPNPYTIDAQVDLLLSFCSEMGFTSVVLVGHDDGGLLALMAAQRVQSSTNFTNVKIKGIVLLGVSLSRELVPAFARVLLRTSLGKKHLVRPLLRTEITQVVNRRAWYDTTKLTTEVLSLYKAPLCVEGWDEALHEIGKQSYETVLSPEKATALLKAVECLPVLVIGGAEDAVVPLKSVQAMASKLVNSRLVAISGCGHLPHEECPKALLAAMSPFINRILVEQLQNQ